MFASPSKGNFPYRLAINSSFKVNIHGVPLAGRKHSRDMASNTSFPVSQSLQSKIYSQMYGQNHRAKIYFNEIRNSSMGARRPGLSISRCTTLENNILRSTHECKLLWLHGGGYLC
jgi:hypothetical protein